MKKTYIYSCLKHEKEYTLLLNSGKKVTAMFYERRRLISLPELSVTFNPKLQVPSNVIVTEKECINSFFVLNEVIDNNIIDSIYIDDVAYKMVNNSLNQQNNNTNNE